MSNDISARDVQLEKGQFYESKSYPTFTPTGPRLVLLAPEDFEHLPGLRPSRSWRTCCRRRSSGDCSSPVSNEIPPT